MDTSRLRNSIAWNVTGTFTVEVGTKVEYASKIQYGDLVTLDISLAVQDCIEKYLKKHPEREDDLRGFITGEAYEMDILVQPRPFVMATPEDRADIRQLVLDHVKGDPGAEKKA